MLHKNFPSKLAAIKNRLTAELAGRNSGIEQKNGIHLFIAVNAFE